MASRVIQGDVFEVLPMIERGSVNTCVTSPPYWKLRSYLPKGHRLKHLELGQEKTPALYVANMVRVFGLVRECLADHGTCWINIGDTYTHAAGKRKTTDPYGAKQMSNGYEATTENASFADIEDGSLCLIPQRLMVALQDDGWIVRSVVVWHKPAPMPASIAGWRWQRCRVKIAKGGRMKGEKKGSTTNGRPHGARAANGKDFASTSHFGAPQSKLVGHSGNDLPNGAEWEDCPGCKKCQSTGGYVLRRGSWRPTNSYEPLIFLAKSSKYFADGEPVKTQAAAATISRNEYTRVLDDEDEQFAVRHDHESNMTTANLRDVWTIASEPLKEKHYAAYPTELCRRCIESSTSAKGYCVKCGMPWVRIIENGERFPNGHGASKKSQENVIALRGDNSLASSVFADGMTFETKTVGWRCSCQCKSEDTRPGLVLDPFCGSGRTGIAANRLGLDFVGVELSPDYADMGRRKIKEDSPLFNT